MAKYTIKHVCGHEEEIQLFGSWAERESRIKAMEETHCAACRAAQDAATCAAWGWPESQGTARQVAWADSIRIRFRREVWDKVHGKITDEAKAAALYDIINAFVTEHTDATFWIDNRYELDSWDSAGRLVSIWYKNRK